MPNLSINPSTPIVLGGQGPTITANGANTYSWSPATNLSSTSGSTVTANPQITSNYTLTGTSSAGCVSNDMFSVGVELWQQTADTFHAPIYYNGNVGIGTGTNTPQAALDVVGNAIITGTLTAGGLNSTNGNLNVSTPAVFTNTVTISTLSVTGNATFDSVNTGKRLTFNDANSTIKAGITFIPGTINQAARLVFGNPNIPAPTSIVTCNSTNAIGLYNSVQDQTQYYNAYGYTGSAVGTRVLNVGTDFSGASIDLAGVKDNGTSGVLLIDYYCGKDVNICTNPSNGGGLNGQGGVVSVGQNFQIGNPTFNVNTALNINSIGSTAINVQNGPSNQNVFNVANNGSTILGYNANNNSTYTASKMLTVNGDVCFANEPGSGNTNDGLSGIEILGNDGIPTARGISVEADPNGDFNFYLNGNQGYGTGVVPAEFNYKIHNGNGTVTNLMTLNGSGQLIIGHPANSSLQNTPNYNTTWPYKTALLQVNGNVVIGSLGSGDNTNLWVTQTGWSDFVFDKDYKLMPLNEVEKFYKANHHLPDVPAQKDIREKGNNLGQTDVVLLQKIEELTLYMVEQQKRIENLEKKLAEKK